MSMLHTVVGIINRKHKILIAERPLDKPYSGYWEFPGGKIEKNETGKEALTRELYEELGIEVVSAAPWFLHTHTYPDKTVCLDIWLVTTFSGEPHSKENQTIRWVSPSEMRSLPMLEGNWPIVERIKKLLGEES
jgi:8-oxo-dGTP diphosphatase